MDKKKISLKKEVEDTLACSAFAEAGEPCPINTGEETKTASHATSKKKESTLGSVENTMACSAFTDEGEPCPENIEKKK